MNNMFKVCWCSLPALNGNSDCCKNCGTSTGGYVYTTSTADIPLINYPKLKDNWLQDWLDEFEKASEPNKSYKNYQLVDTDGYDIVEKKDAKIKKLKESIEASKRQKDNNRTLINMKNEKIKEFNDNIKKCDEDIEKLEQELKQLEEGK